ncbi:MAG: hypothetical protein LBM70_05160 [Victivallales bacterium]|nr:hypothetical protein [Victivallales bacterium]
MSAVYILVMILALIGMIVCSKKQKANPAMQPVGFVLFVVVIISAGLLLKEMNVFGTSSGPLQSEIRFYVSQGSKTGDYLKSVAPGKKVLLIVENATDQNENLKKLADALKENYGGDVVIDAPAVEGVEEGTPIYYAMKAKDFDELVEKHADAGIVVSTIGLPEDMKNLKFTRLSEDKRPLLFLLGLPNGAFTGLYQAIQNGVINGVIVPNPKANYEETAPSDPVKAFDMRYVLVTKANAEEYKSSLAI